MKLMNQLKYLLMNLLAVDETDKPIEISIDEPLNGSCNS